MTVLAPLVWRPSPNRSSRHGHAVTHLVWHSTIGAYHPSIDWLCNPLSDASCHPVIREDGGEVTQLVKLAEKAWHAFPTWNLCSVGVEHASTSPGFASHEQMLESARLFAWLCWKERIPPLHGIHRPKGIVRHRDLGAAGGGHKDGPTDRVWFHEFLPLVQAELARGGFRKVYLR